MSPPAPFVVASRVASRASDASSFVSVRVSCVSSAANSYPIEAIFPVVALTATKGRAPVTMGIARGRWYEDDASVSGGERAGRAAAREV